MRILAIDLGTKSVGLAISGPLEIPQPLKSITRRNVFEELSRIIDEYSVSLIIVGLPLTLDGEEKKTARDARKFAEETKKRFKIETILMDERFTTEEGKRILSGLGIKWDKDSISALLILERYIEDRKEM